MIIILQVLAMEVSIKTDYTARILIECNGSLGLVDIFKMGENGAI